MRVKEIKKINKKDIVIPDYIMRPLENETEEENQNLSASIKKSGLINEIDVRLIEGRYELMAGARRFVATKDDDILVKVYEDVSDLKAMILGLTENLQRKNPDVNLRDSYIYKVWIKGNEEGYFKYVKDLAKEIGMSEATLNIILYAGDLKDKVKLPEIQNATSRELYRIKPILGHLDIVVDLLRKLRNNQLNSLELENISGDIKSELDKGTDKDIIMKSLELAGYTVNNTVKKYFKSDSPSESSLETTRIINSDDIASESTECEQMVVAGKISDKIFKEILVTYKDSPDDIKEKLDKKEISVDNARIVNQFETPERRDYVLKDINRLEKSQKTSNEVHEYDKRMIIDTRLKQQCDINKTGTTESKTRLDMEDEKKFEEEANRDRIHDQKYLDRYQRMSSYILETVSHYNPKNLRTEDIKRKASIIFKSHYELLYDILVDIGEIKEVRPRDKDLNIKRLASEEVKIVSSI